MTRPVALVTGAARGIGRAAALALAGQGYDVAVNYSVSEAAAQQVAEQIRESGVSALAVPAGVVAAARQGRAADHAIGVLSLLGLSVPNFALGPLLILLFSVEIGWLPVSGRGGWQHLVLPAVTLGAALAAILTRMVRSAMLGELFSDSVRTARAKGASEFAVYYRHALRNAVLPVVTVLGLQFGNVLAGAILVETVFTWPGLGRLAFASVLRRDYPTILGTLLFSSILVVVMNQVTDFCYRLIDPRIKTG